MVPALALAPATHIVEQTSRLCPFAGFGAFQARSMDLGAFTSSKYDCRLEIYGCTTSPSFSTFTSSTFLCECAVESEYHHHIITVPHPSSTPTINTHVRFRQIFCSLESLVYILISHLRHCLVCEPVPAAVPFRFHLPASSTPSKTLYLPYLTLPYLTLGRRKHPFHHSKQSSVIMRQP